MKWTHLLLIVNTSTYCENGAPPDKFNVRYSLLHVEIYGFNSRIYASCCHTLVPGIN